MKSNNRLIDPPFFGAVLAGNIPAVQYIIDTIIGTGKVTVNQVRLHLGNADDALGAFTALTVEGTGAEGQMADIEIEIAEKNLHPKYERLRIATTGHYYLAPNPDDDIISDVYMIYIIKGDFCDMGLPVYHGLNQVFANGEYICDANDGLFCFYVNGDFRDPQHPIGRMMHDFYCTDPEDMLVPVLKEAVRIRALDSLYGSLPNNITEEDMQEERLKHIDPFFDPYNVKQIENSIQELRRGKGTAHELIED